MAETSPGSRQRPGPSERAVLAFSRLEMLPAGWNPKEQPCRPWPRAVWVSELGFGASAFPSAACVLGLSWWLSEKTHWAGHIWLEREGGHFAGWLETHEGSLAGRVMDRQTKCLPEPQSPAEAAENCVCNALLCTKLSVTRRRGQKAPCSLRPSGCNSNS